MMILTLTLALEKAPSEDEREKTIEDNGRTSRPTRSPKSPLPISLPRTVSGPVPDIMDPIAETDPNVEDYSVLAMDEDDSILQSSEDNENAMGTVSYGEIPHVIDHGFDSMATDREYAEFRLEMTLGLTIA
jgi:hypothetical protein